MPGGWAMSMIWMRMPGQSWLGAATSFVGMWVVMMVAMMLPSLTPTLWRYHQDACRNAGARAGRLTAIVALGYFFVWAVLGVVVFPLGAMLADVAMRESSLARVAPIVIGAAVLVAGVLQYTGWKARHLALCREPLGHGMTLQADVRTAWRHGVCLGLHCSLSCAGLTTLLLALGVMDGRVMAAVAAAITAERLAPDRLRVARVVGIAVVGAALLLIARVGAPAPRRWETSLQPVSSFGRTTNDVSDSPGPLSPAPSTASGTSAPTATRDPASPPHTARRSSSRT